MHGAGTTHIFHSAIGQPNCCALIELFPDPTIELHTAQGYGNLARQLGFYHYRNVAGWIFYISYVFYKLSSQLLLHLVFFYF